MTNKFIPSEITDIPSDIIQLVSKYTDMTEIFKNDNEDMKSIFSYDEFNTYKKKCSYFSLDLDNSILYVNDELFRKSILNKSEQMELF